MPIMALTDEECRHYDWLIRELLASARRTRNIPGGDALLARTLDLVEDLATEVTARVAETPLNIDRETRRLEEAMFDELDGHDDGREYDLMIEKGHVHTFVVIQELVLPDGRTRYHSHCICGLEERRFFIGDAPMRVEYRFGKVWMDARDIIRAGHVRVVECGMCDGAQNPRGILCGGCFGAGVTEPDGTPVVKMPAPEMSEPQPVAAE